MLNITDIAKICHQANKAYCESIGDISQKDWDDSPDWQKVSAVSGVSYHLNTPDAKVSDTHVEWFGHKLREGWKYGPIKDPDKKEHPCMVPFEKLPIEQQIKDYLFKGIVDSLKDFINK